MTSRTTVNELPLCSAIVPVYNGEKCIVRCLNALMAQTIPSTQMEVIVVDDGSTDATAARVAAWIERHPGAATLVRQANSGAASARNYGAQLARGRYLLFTDADCVPSSDWAQVFVNRFEQPDQPAALMGSYTSNQLAPAAQFAQLEFEERYALMAKHNAIDLVATYSAAYRRDIFLAAGGFDPSLIMNEDVDLAYRLSAQGHRLVFAPAARVEHHHLESWLGYARLKVGRGFWRTLVYRRFPQKAVRDSYTPQLLKIQAPLAILAACSPLFVLIARSLHFFWLLLPFLITAAPTALRAQRRGAPALQWVLWGVWVRSLALITGIVWAILSPRSMQEKAAVKLSQVVPGR